MEAFWLVVVGLLILSVIIDSDSASVGNNSLTILSRVKRGCAPPSCRKQLKYSDYPEEDGEETSGEDGAIVPIVKDCRCSFEECCCKDDKSAKNKEVQHKEITTQAPKKDAAGHKAKASKNNDLAKEKNPGFLDSESEDEHQDKPSVDPETGKSNRKQTFQEYYHTRRRQEIMDFLRNYYLTHSKRKLQIENPRRK